MVIMEEKNPVIFSKLIIFLKVRLGTPLPGYTGA